MSDPGLDALFAPESVAIVGASPDSFYTSRIMDNLTAYGYDGTVYPVNPGREEVWGRHCYDDIGDLPEVVDLALVSVPREVAVGVVEDTADAGIPAALVITAGFSEADEAGADLEDGLAAVAAESDIRVCGPNSLGVLNSRDGVVLSAACSREPIEGSVALVSQSGALAFNTFYERAADEDLGFSHVVSSGNEVDQSVSDYVEYFAADPGVEVVCAYVEGVDDPRRFARVSARAVESGTPVLAVKVGRTDAAAAAALSHTGSLTGADEIWDAALAGAGVERVGDIPDLLDAATVHAAHDPPGGRRVCVLSTSGGLASLLADLATERGLELPELSPETEQALLDMEELLTFGEVHNPADVRGYGAEVLPELADAVLPDDRFDAYVFAIGLSAVDDRAARMADDLSAIAERADDPVVVLWTGRKAPADLDDPQPYQRLRREVPTFYDPARCMDALASLVSVGQADPRPPADPTPSADAPDVALPGDAVLSWEEAAALLSAHGIETVPTRSVEGPAAAAAAAADLGFPVVVKVASRDVVHRDAAGGVVLDVTTEAAAREAYERVVSAVREARPDAGIDGALVQPQVAAGVEAIVGASRDPGFGPTVSVGSGGVLVETIEDRALRLAPIGEDVAGEAIEETALGERLSADGRARLADVVARVSRLATDHPSVAELDLNPVLVDDAGASVVDVLVRTD